MFFRIKKIKGNEYAYLVKNKWTRKGTRQKVGKYLGKVIHLRKSIDSDSKPNSLSDFQTKTPKEIIDELIEYELIQHGFRRSDGPLNLDGIIYEKRKLRPNVVLSMNEGFFCNYSLSNLYGFNFMGDETETGQALASALISAGIDITQEVFIQLFKKVYKSNMASRL